MKIEKSPHMIYIILVKNIYSQKQLIINSSHEKGVFPHSCSIFSSPNTCLSVSLFHISSYKLFKNSLVPLKIYCKYDMQAPNISQEQHILLSAAYISTKPRFTDCELSDLGIEQHIRIITFFLIVKTQFKC